MLHGEAEKAHCHREDHCTADRVTIIAVTVYPYRNPHRKERNSWNASSNCFSRPIS